MQAQANTVSSFAPPRREGADLASVTNGRAIPSTVGMNYLLRLKDGPGPS